MTYQEMYEEAAIMTDGTYKGYTGANALSKYVDDNYNVNAAASMRAHNALCDAMSLLDI